MHSLKQWIKFGEHPVARRLYRLAKSLRRIEMPVLPGLHKSLYQIHQGVTGGYQSLLRIIYWTPLFKSRLSGPAPALWLDGSGLPLVLGPVSITMDEDVRLSTQVTISGRSSGDSRPTLTVGRNCDIGWQTTIAVGRRVVIEDNVRIAGRAFLAGYPGHPLDSKDRAAGLPDTDEQVGDIVLMQGVWLATGVTVNAGVTIGVGTVVAAGSVVTHDLPAGVLAGGVPARPIRSLCRNPTLFCAA